MIRRAFFFMSLLGLLALAMPQAASAAGFKPFTSACTGDATSSTLCSDSKSTDNPLTGCPSNCGNGLLMKIVNIVAYVAGAAAVILIIVGAIRYVTSGSDTSVGSRIDDDVLNAKRTIANALIGLAIIVLAKVIITYVIRKLS